MQSNDSRYLTGCMLTKPKLVPGIRNVRTLTLPGFFRLSAFAALTVCMRGGETIIPPRDEGAVHISVVLAMHFTRHILFFSLRPSGNNDIRELCCSNMYALIRRRKGTTYRRIRFPIDSRGATKLALRTRLRPEQLSAQVCRCTRHTYRRGKARGTPSAHQRLALLGLRGPVVWFNDGCIYAHGWSISSTCSYSVLPFVKATAAHDNVWLATLFSPMLHQSL